MKKLIQGCLIAIGMSGCVTPSSVEELDAKIISVAKHNIYMHCEAYAVNCTILTGDKSSCLLEAKDCVKKHEEIFDFVLDASRDALK